jgi:hypothetical protein
MDDEGPAAEIGFDDEEDFGLEQEDDLDDESDEDGGKVAELEARIAELESQIAELMDLEKEEHPELGDEEDEDKEEMEEDELDDDDIDDDEEDLDEDADNEQTRNYDFKDKGRPGLYDMDESADEDDEDTEDLDESVEQFPKNKLHGKKSSRLGGKLDAKLHNMLDDNQDKDDKELDNLESELTKNGANTSRIKAIIENLRAKSVNEAEESDEADELKDEDLDSLDTSDETPETEDDTATTLDGEEEVEKVEITEFIITVDDPDIAIEELSKLGVIAERVEAEPKEEEVPMEIEDEPAEGEEKPAQGEEGDDEGVDIDLDLGGGASESLRAFIQANYLSEAEEGEEKPAEEVGTSDELGLGDQGQEAKELEEPSAEEEPVEATTEFEENKIKVKAQDWDVLKGWLEEKGVDVKEMFGGDIESETELKYLITSLVGVPTNKEMDFQ